MVSVQRSLGSSPMGTAGPAMSFLTCFWLCPQKEHLSRSPPSPMRAMSADPSPIWRARTTHPCDGTRSTRPRGSIRAPEFRVTRRPVELVLAVAADVAADSDRGELATLDDLVDDPVLLGVLRREDLLAFDVDAHVLDRTTRVPRECGLQQRAGARDLVGLDLQVGDLR